MMQLWAIMLMKGKKICVHFKNKKQKQYIYSLTGIYFLKTSNSTPFALGRVKDNLPTQQPNWRANYDLDMLNEEACDQLLMCRFLRYGVEYGMDVDVPPDFS